MFLVPVNRSASDLVRNFDRLFDASLDRFFTGVPAGASSRSPALDAAESEQAYTVTLDLPGVAPQTPQILDECIGVLQPHFAHHGCGFGQAANRLGAGRVDFAFLHSRAVQAGSVVVEAEFEATCLRRPEAEQRDGGSESA